MSEYPSYCHNAVAMATNLVFCLPFWQVVLRQLSAFSCSLLALTQKKVLWDPPSRQKDCNKSERKGTFGVVSRNAALFFCPAAVPSEYVAHAAFLSKQKVFAFPVRWLSERQRGNQKKQWYQSTVDLVLERVHVPQRGYYGAPFVPKVSLEPVIWTEPAALFANLHPYSSSPPQHVHSTIHSQVCCSECRSFSLISVWYLRTVISMKHPAAFSI